MRVDVCIKHSYTGVQLPPSPQYKNSLFGSFYIVEMEKANCLAFVGSLKQRSYVRSTSELRPAVLSIFDPPTGGEENT